MTVIEGELVGIGELFLHLGQLRCLQEQRWDMGSFWLGLTSGVVEEQEDEELEPQKP